MVGDWDRSKSHTREKCTSVQFGAKNEIQSWFFFFFLRQLNVSNRKKERERNTMSLSQLTPTSAYENTELSAHVPVGSYRAETPRLLWIKVLMQGLFFFFSTPDLRDPLCTCTNTDWQSMCPFAIHLSVLAPSCRLIHHVKWCRLKLCGLWLWHTAGHQKSPSPSGLCNIAFKSDW